MKFDDLQSWLSWQETLHTAEIELGLDRIQQVASNMGIDTNWSIPVITVAGTNGKGSSVAILEAIYQHAGYRVGSYTSPHLIHYNERIKINRQPVSDQLICEAFELVDQARQQTAEAISLTYFEFGTLAALSILKQAELDLVILEVGLGGRLDAVNIIDAQVALLTPVSIDHQSWLGNTREEIAAEKAGVIKQGSVVVCSDPQPAAAIVSKAHDRATAFYRLGDDFLLKQEADTTSFQSASLNITHLPIPNLEGSYQLDNAAAAIQVSQVLNQRLAVNEQAISAALDDIQLAGRYQQLASSPDIIVDVAHNAQAVTVLADNLRNRPCKGRTLAVLAMLEDKSISEALAAIDKQIDYYYLASLEGSRALSADDLKQRVQETLRDDKLSTERTVQQAINRAIAEAEKYDRIVIFGSFLTVSAAIEQLQ